MREKLTKLVKTKQPVGGNAGIYFTLIKNRNPEFGSLELELASHIML